MACIDWNEDLERICADIAESKRDPLADHIKAIVDSDPGYIRQLGKLMIDDDDTPQSLSQKVYDFLVEDLK